MLSGDVHHSRVLEIGLRNRTVHELVISPAFHIPTVGSIAVGSYGGQDQGKVGITEFVEIDGNISGGVKPKLSRYLFGTDAKNAIAFLHFRMKGNTSIGVGSAFIDLDTLRVPHSTKANLLGWFGGSLEPAIPECQAYPLFTLH